MAWLWNELKCQAFEKYRYFTLTFLKHWQFYGAVNALCSKLRGIIQDISVASKLFHSYCCSFYGCQPCDLSSNYIEYIYVSRQKAMRQIFNLPYNTHRYMLHFIVGSPHTRVNLVNRFNNFFDVLMSSDNKMIELLVYNCHFSNTPLALKENSWICTAAENATKLKKLTEHCYYHYWMFDVQIGLSLIFINTRLNVWFMMFAPIDLDILW